jgi:Fuc2NAc and GlcNAc transferase
VGVALIYSLLAAHIEALSTPLGSVELGPVLGVLGSTLWIVVVTNAVNFMDGANGLSPGSLVIALTVLGLSSGHGLGALALMGAAAGLGFLPWNLPGGRIFQGDAGALFSSALFAGLVLMAAGPLGEGAISVWFGPLALLPMLTDVFLTLLARARRRKSLLQAHRDHLFQRWLLARKASHGALSVRVWALMALAGLCAMGMQRLPIPQHSLVFAAALAVCVIGWRWSDRRVRGR